MFVEYGFDAGKGATKGQRREQAYYQSIAGIAVLA